MTLGLIPYPSEQEGCWCPSRIDIYVLLALAFLTLLLVFLAGCCAYRLCFSCQTYCCRTKKRESLKPAVMTKASKTLYQIAGKELNSFHRFSYAFPRFS